MTNLTEQWKKGELLEGHYYVKDGGNMIAEYLDGYFYNDGQPMTSFTGGVDEVLAPVPSYEEVVAMKDCLKMVWEAAEREVKLKKLLKECLPYISRSLTSRMIKNSAGYKKDVKLLTKINQVLGEKNNGN